MNKWLYRAVGVASGALLMGGGVAHAKAADQPPSPVPGVDPQVMRELLAGYFTPTGGQHHLSLTFCIPTADRTLPIQPSAGSARQRFNSAGQRFSVQRANSASQRFDRHI